MYSDDLILKASIVEQILRKRMSLIMPVLEDFLWQDDASRYKWLSVGLLYAVACERLLWIKVFLNLENKSYYLQFSL